MGYWRVEVSKVDLDVFSECDAQVKVTRVSCEDVKDCGDIH
jgi:hypothetical protein